MLIILPFEILQFFINYLSIKDLVKLRITNKENQELVKLYDSYDPVRITGPLKYWKKSFPNLKYANISSRKDIKNIDFQYLDNIEKLDMRLCNQPVITNKVFYYLSNIKELNLQGCSKKNNFTDKIFDHIPNLEKLYIDENHLITDNGIKKILKIKDLSICNCSQITNNGLSGLTNLVKLYIYNLYRLTDEVFKNMNKLENLKIIFCNFTDQGILLLKNIKKLDFLNCKNIKGTNFDQLTKLHSVDFMYCGIDDNDLIYLKNVYNISLYGCNINGYGFNFLENVKSLTIYDSLIKDEYIDDLLKLENLDELYFYRCFSISYSKKLKLKKILGNKFKNE